MSASDGGFNAGATRTEDGPAGPAGATPVRGGGPLPPTFVDTLLVPMCLGNSPGGADAMCTAATTGCEADNQIRMWVYQRTVTRATGETTGYRLGDPPVRCVGPDEPAIDPRVAIAAMIESEFRRVLVVRGDAVVNPHPRTLVHTTTTLETSAPERYDIPLQLLGQDVVITAQAERWTWHTGEGTKTTEAKGTRGRVEHQYRTARQHAPYVVITWSGTYSVNGQPMGAVPGTVTTTGEPGSIDVREARTQLVDQ